jgi:hypothetical protein
MAILPLEQIRDGVGDDPSIFPQNLDLARERILFVRLSREDFRAASFLDDRILTAQSEGRWVGFEEVAPLVEGVRPSAPLHFIFHTGHVGSTLLSRLLDDAEGVLGLREPVGLRVLASAFDAAGQAPAEPLQTLLDWHLRLWARGYRDTKAVVLKATSSAARLHPRLLHALAQARAIYLNLRAEPFLATLLAGENSHLDLRGHGPERVKRLAAMGARLETGFDAMSLGELAAMTWAAETLTQKEAERAFATRVLSLDFDALLSAPGETLRRACAHFDLQAPETFFANAGDSPTLKRYAKAPEHIYTPELRGEILAHSRVRNAREIAKGLAWLERLAQAHAPAGDILSA